MLERICLALCMLACVPAWSQIQINAAGTGNTADVDSSALNVPAPVSVLPYSSTFEGENDSNFLTGGIAFTTAWASNVAWGTATPISDVSYSIFPTIGLNKTTSRMNLILNYAPGFTFYQHTTSLNQGNQNFSTSFQYHLTPNLTATLSEGFQRTSNVFDQPNPLLATPVSGGVPVSPIAIVSPGENMLANLTSAQLSYQVSADSLIGGGGNYANQSYSNPGQVNNPTQFSNLYNSRSAGGSVFYATRLHEKAFVGVSYLYQNSLSFQQNAPSTHTQTQTVFLFLTMNLRPSFSVSVSAGPQYYSSAQALQPSSSSLQPLTMISANWRGERTTVSASYARMVTGSGGLSGAFHSNTASLGLTWQVSRNWNTGVSGSYSDFQTLTPEFLYSSLGGHTLLGTASLQRRLSDHANVQLGYNWTHQTYPGIVTFANNPNINRVFVTLNFTFSKPLQR